MVTRITGAPDGDKYLGGVLLTEREWTELTAPLGMADDASLDQVLGRAAQMVHRGVDAVDADGHPGRVVVWPESDWMTLLRPLMDADGIGCSFPPDMDDLTARILRLLDAKRAAEHRVKALAGEVADLTDRLERTLPDVFGTVLDQLGDGIRRDDLLDDAPDVIREVASEALRVATRLVTDYDVRDRDQARPADLPPAFRATQAVIDAVVARVREGGRADPVEVQTVEQFKRMYPDPRTSARGMIIRPDELDKVAQETGWPHLGCDTCSDFIGRAFTITIPDEIRAHCATEHSITHTVWGVPLDADHPAVMYLATHLGPLKGCDGSMRCRRATIARTLLDACEGSIIPAVPSGQPLDSWIGRAAEHLADVVPATITRGELVTVTRQACDHAARLILGPNAGHDPTETGTT